MGQNNTRDYHFGSAGRAVEAVRLDSWKEIASYLHRDARTVRRWERERRLPVHRVPGGERSGVFAYVSELEQWLRKVDVPQTLTTPEVPEKILDPSAAPGIQSVIPEIHSAAISNVTREVEGFATGSSQRQSITGANELSSAAPPLSVGAVSTRVNEPSSANTAAPILAEQHQQLDPYAHLLLKIPVNSASTKGVSPRWAVHTLAMVLVLAIVGGSGFAFIHYHRFHRAGAGLSHSSPEAQELYLRGRYYWNLRTEESLNQAVDFFTQAIVNDPHFAPAYAGLADSYLLMRQYGHMPDAEAYPRALAAARQAVALDPNSPDAHRSVAFVLCFWDWDMLASEREYLRSIELDPKNSQTHHWYATALLSWGRTNEALTQIDIARALEPQSVSVLADRGLILGFKDLSLGEEALRDVVKIQPGFVSAHAYLSDTYLDLGKYSSFLDEARVAATLRPDPVKLTILDQAIKDLDKRGPQFMLHNLATAFAGLMEHGQVSAYTTAKLFGMAGDAAQAVLFLKLARDNRDPGYLCVSREAAFRHLRNSPAFLALIARKDLPAVKRREPIARLDRPLLFSGLR